MIKVSVTAEDMDQGIIGDCYECAVALALNRATGDTESMVYEHDFSIYLKVNFRSISAPYEVRSFVHDFDAQPRTEDNHVDTAHPDYEPLKPFDFELPDQDKPEWLEGCQDCGELFEASELGDEGCCEDCRARP
jgi:hypothetical protein